MSRIGKRVIEIPSTVKVDIEEGEIHIQGPKGIPSLPLSLAIPRGIEIQLEDKNLEVKRTDNSARLRSLHGVTRTRISNMVRGVSEGFEIKLEIEGLGFKAAVEKENLNLQLGYTEPIIFHLPKGVGAKVEANTKVTLFGPDKEVLGRSAAEIRNLRPPEPYKGTGIRYAGEVITRKAGKTTGAGATT